MSKDVLNMKWLKILQGSSLNVMIEAERKSKEAGQSSWKSWSLTEVCQVIDTVLMPK